MKYCSEFISIALFIALLQLTAFQKIHSQSTSSWDPGNIQGTVFLDNNDDGLFDITDNPIQGIMMEAFEDVNYNGYYDDNDIKVSDIYTGVDGMYRFDVHPTNKKSVKRSISVSSDDAVQNEPGGIMILDGQVESGVREIGLRFTDIDLPNGAEILDVQLILTAASSSVGNPEVIITGEDSDNASTFTIEEYNIHNRPRAASQVVWNASQPVSANENFIINGFESIIEEIISRNGWQQGNSLALMVADFDMVVYMFDGGFAPQLTITFADPTITRIDYIVRPVTLANSHTSQFTTVSERIVSMTEFDTEEEGVDFSLSSSTVLAEDNNIIGQQSMEVFPNPATGSVTIQFSDQARSDYIVRVFDICGKIMDNSVVSNSESSIHYDLGHLAAGNYFIEVSTRDFTGVKKIIVR